MSWQIPTTANVMSEFTPSEQKSIAQVMGDMTDANLGAILNRTIAEVRGYIRSGAYQLDLNFTNSLPVELFPDCIAITRWRFLISAPSLVQLQTPERRQSVTDAFTKLNAIAQQDFVVEPPGGDQGGNRAGNWNSENKLIMRTHPIPTPATQFTPQINTYANPDAPPDREPS